MGYFAAYHEGINTIFDHNKDFYFPELANVETHIRLFTFNPHAHDDEADDIHIELTCHSRDSANNAYVAISYEWGSFADPRTITVNTQNFTITANGFQALQQVRNVAEHSYFWMDAICINQNGAAEKSHQVKAMGRVYSEAQKVIACTDTASRLHRPIRIYERQAIGESKVDIRKDLAEATAMARFTSTYFGRMWIVQEFLLAKELYLFANNTGIPAEIFEDAFGQAQSIPGSGIPSYGQSRYESRFVALLGQRYERRVRPTSLQPFCAVIDRYAGGGCSDPRDQLYALLGLASDQGFVVDYTRDTYTVFFDFVRYTAERLNLVQAGAVLTKLAQAMQLTPGWLRFYLQQDPNLHFLYKCYAADFEGLSDGDTAQDKIMRRVWFACFGWPLNYDLEFEKVFMRQQLIMNRDLLQVPACNVVMAITFAIS